MHAYMIHRFDWTVSHNSIPTVFCFYSICHILCYCCCFYRTGVRYGVNIWVVMTCLYTFSLYLSLSLPCLGLLGFKVLRLFLWNVGVIDSFHYSLWILASLIIIRVYNVRGDM